MDRSPGSVDNSAEVRRAPGPHFSPPFYYARRSARRVGAYSLQPGRSSVSYAFAVFRSVPPPQRHPDALATNGGEICGLGSALSDRLEQYNPRGHRYIQALHGSRHGNGHQVIADFPGKTPQTLAFGAHDHGQRSAKVGSI